MGLFSRPKCPIHRIEYSIGSNGLTNHYYCKKCRQTHIDERNKKLSTEKEIESLKKRLENLENQRELNQ